MVEVATSLLNVKRENAIRTLYDLEAAKTDYFHIDVMDGKFVSNDTSSIMREYCEYLNSISNLPLDVHLMVEDVKSYIDSYLVYEPNVITFHYEACKDKEQVLEYLKYIKERNCRVGLAIKPNTPIEEITEFLPYMHMVLIMTVEPGKGRTENTRACYSKSGSNAKILRNKPYRYRHGSRWWCYLRKCFYAYCERSEYNRGRNRNCFVERLCKGYRNNKKWIKDTRHSNLEWRVSVGWSYLR